MNLNPLDFRSTPSQFSNKIRAKIFLFLDDLWNVRGGETQEPWTIFEEKLKRKIGSLDVGSGSWPKQRLQHFILHAREDELLDLMELVSEVEDEFLSSAGRGHGFRLAPDAKLETQLERIADGLNSLLSEAHYQAHFDNRGILRREPSIHALPPSMANLPSKQTLRDDLQNLITTRGIFTILFLDLDYFKTVNDSSGHLVGDKYLEQYVRVVQSCIQGKGRLYLYGGDEMVVVLRNFTRDEAQPVGERIRVEVERTHWPSESKLTVSIGLADSASVNPSEVNALLTAADTAMYKSKESGRNRVTIYSASSA